MLSFLKQSSLSELAHEGAGGTKLPAIGESTTHNSASAVVGSTVPATVSGFTTAGIMVASTAKKGKPRAHKPKGTKSYVPV